MNFNLKFFFVLILIIVIDIIKLNKKGEVTNEIRRIIK